MDDTTNNKEEVAKIYEIGYLIVPSIPEEGVEGEVEKLKKIVSDAGSTVIAEEMPHREQLAYTMRTKTLSGAYNSYEEAYFGWIKFETNSNKIESIKKDFETIPSILRILVINTVREDTYLGKRAQVVADSLGMKAPMIGEVVSEEKTEIKKETPQVSIEELDRSIDEIVKEAK